MAQCIVGAPITTVYSHVDSTQNRVMFPCLSFTRTAVFLKSAEPLRECVPSSQTTRCGVGPRGCMDGTIRWMPLLKNGPMLCLEKPMPCSTVGAWRRVCWRMKTGCGATEIINSSMQISIGRCPHPLSLFPVERRSCYLTKTPMKTEFLMSWTTVRPSQTLSNWIWTRTV